MCCCSPGTPSTAWRGSCTPAHDLSGQLLRDTQVRGFSTEKVFSGGLSCAEVTRSFGCLRFWVTLFELFYYTLSFDCCFVFQGACESL